MGRIHRYSQKQNVLVFNMVASNAKEGKVLERLLSKLDIIREGMGDDRVYDVIQDVLEALVWMTLSIRYSMERKLNWTSF